MVRKWCACGKLAQGTFGHPNEGCQVWKERMGCKTGRYGMREWGARQEGLFMHPGGPKHDLRMVAKRVVDMECVRLEVLDCATGWG